MGFSTATVTPGATMSLHSRVSLRHRRDFLRIGGMSLCGVTLLDVLRARAGDTRVANTDAAPRTAAKAKHLICVWLGGGPPHTDMFDMKPDAPAEYRGEFKPIASKVPGLQVCELMPGLARL